MDQFWSSFTGLGPLFFCLLPGSTDNTNAKYSMNFFFSLAHTENTGKRAFLIFLCHEHAWCFENLEKKSKKRVILAIWGGLKMCVYSCAQQLSQGESQGFPQTCIPHSKFYCWRGCFLCMRSKKRCLLMLLDNFFSQNLINELRRSDWF